MSLPVLLAFSGMQLFAQGDYHWRGSVARGSLIEIRGINGDVRAVSSHTNEVEVTATIQAQESPSAVQVRLVRHEKGVTVCAVFPGQEFCPSSDTGPGARIDFEVRLPEGVHFAGSTVNGGIEAELFNGDVQASTVNGQVRVSTAGTLQAKTVNGSINASLLKPFWSKPPELSTVNGGIRLVMPPSANASVQAETKNGKIVSDFRAKGRVSDREVVGRIGGAGGSAGRPLVLRTINGVIELKRGW